MGVQRKRHSPEVVAERERRMEGRRWRTRVLEVVVRQRSLTVASCASTPLMVTSHITKSSDFAFQHPSGTFIHQKSKQSPKEPRAGPHSQERSKPGKYAENTKHTEYMQGIDIVLDAVTQYSTHPTLTLSTASREPHQRHATVYSSQGPWL